MRVLLAVLWKDLLTEWRSHDRAIAMLLFSLLVVVIFHFSLPGGATARMQSTAPGLLWVSYVLTRKWRLGPGGYGAIFLWGYGVGRFCLEYVRKPDSQFINADNPGGAVLLGMTMGQSLCAGMVLAGLLLFLYSRSRRDAADPGIA